MSESDPDRLDARLSRVEGILEQMDKRIGRLQEQLDRASTDRDSIREEMNSRFDQQERGFRRDMFLLFVGLSAVFSLIQFGFMVYG